MLPGEFTRNADFSLPTERLQARHRGGGGPRDAASSTPRGSPPRCSASRIGANMFMLGYACQIGALPLVAGRDRAGDRAQRRRGRDEHRRLPLGPPRRGRRARRSKR